MNITELEPLKTYTLRSINEKIISADTGRLLKTLRGMGFTSGAKVTLLRHSGKDLIVKCGSTRAAMNGSLGEILIV